MNTYTATIPANSENFTFKLPYTYMNTPSIKCVVSSESEATRGSNEASRGSNEATNYLTVTFQIAKPIDEQSKRSMRRAINTIANMASSTAEPVLEVRDKNNKTHSVVE